MVQEEQPHRNSNSSSGGGGGGGGGSGGRSSKRLKQKKIPQRGLGVAQLERIRLEEQHKEDSATTPIGTSAPSCFGVPFTHHHHHHQSTSIPFPRSPIDLSPSKSLFRQSVSIPSLDAYCPPPPPPPPPPPSGGGGVSGGSAIGVSEMSACNPAIWNYSDFPHEGEGPKLDPGFAFRSHLPNKSSLIWSSMPRKQNFPQQQPSSMVNVCLSTSSSSGVNIQLEPPSNQSYYSNCTPPLWPEEEKMVGIKRPWPFSLDNGPGSLECKLPSFGTPICRFDESSSCGNNGMFSLKPGNAKFREGSSCSTSLQPEWRGGMSELNSKNITENRVVDGAFLTLGPPPTSLQSSTTKSIQLPAFHASHYRGYSELELLPYQEGIEEHLILQQGSGCSAQQQPFYSFLPPKGQIDRPVATTLNERRGEIGDCIDLELKL